MPAAGQKRTGGKYWEKKLQSLYQKLGNILLSFVHPKQHCSLHFHYVKGRDGMFTLKANELFPC